MVVLPEPEPPAIRMFRRAWTHAAQEIEHAGGEGFVAQQVVGGKQLLAEAADGEHRADAATAAE